MKYNFDEIINRKNTLSYKWDMEKIKENTLSMWVADMDFKCATPIIEAVKKKADEGVYGYVYHENEIFFNSIINWYKKEYNWQFNKADIIYSEGVVLSLISVIKAFSIENNGVIIQTPVYYPFFEMIENNNRVVIDNKLININGYYEIDFKLLEKQAKKENNTLMILCSPHNPVGRVWKKDELKKIIDICEKNNVVLVSDEIHCDLTRNDIKFIPIGTITDNVISCISPSKTFNMPGISIASVIIKNKAYRVKYKKQAYKKSFLNMASSFNTVAQVAAYSKGSEWLDQVKEYIDGNMEYVNKFIKENIPKIKFVIPEGTYLAWLDFRQFKLTQEEINNKIRNQANIYLSDGVIFGDNGKGFQRINVACPRSIIEECMSRLKEVFS